MILRLGMMLSVVCYEKSIIFYKKNLTLTKNSTFNIIFCNRILPHYHFSPILLKMIEFSQMMAYLFGENILYNSAVPNFIDKVSVAEIAKRI